MRKFLLIASLLLKILIVQAQWSKLGGTNYLKGNGGFILSTCTDANGNIYAAGSFVNASGRGYVAKYDGSTWSELGGANALSAYYHIYSICSDAAGNIYAAGEFINGSNFRYYVAKYDGSTWSELGGTNALSANSGINSICSDAAGNIYAAGNFTNASGFYYVAKYNNVSGWSELGGTNTLLANHTIYSICSDATGNIYAGGSFTNVSSRKYIAKYNGSGWGELGGKNALSVIAKTCQSFYGDLNSICSDAAGNIYTGGAFTDTFITGCVTFVAKYDPSLPTIKGFIFTDDNSNGIKDGNDTYKANVKVQLSNGNYTFTDNNGYYQIQADSIGAYTLTVTPPTGYNALPQTVSYAFNTYDTTVTKDIALQQIVTIDSLSVYAVPMVFNAVQGGAMPYWVQYENCGTSVLSPTVYLNYSNYILNYDSCSDINAIATFNGIATAQTNMQPGQMNNFIAYYDVKPTATIGDTLKTVYGISIGTAIAATDSFYMLVEGGSPNADGQRATPSLTAAQVAAGKDIYYTINFKNTGIDTAFNVVITDTLSSLLQVNTLQMLSSSHKCKTTVKGNLVTFELLNIKLPKASTNALRSLGFVSFKVKPKANLTAGTIITNKANTYYNYRLPFSSVATTIIKAVVTPVQFTMYDVRFTNDRQVENKWTTANEINVSHFNIQRSLNGKDFITIGKVKANGAGDNEYSFIDNSPLSTVDSRPSTYYYRIVSVDKDGTPGFSEIKTINYKPQTLNGFSLFPNPTKDFVTISCKGMTEVRIINSLGQEISRQEPRNDVIIINTQSFNKGVYIVQVITDSGSVKNQKLIIE